MNRLFTVTFVSRNKDNRDIKDFIPRKRSFLTREPQDSENIQKAFDAFCAKGLPGEISRCYYSVNSRDETKLHQSLMHFLIDHPDYDVCKLDAKLVSLASKPEIAETKYWMFDFDIDDWCKVLEFQKDIRAIDADILIETHKTPHGYAVITNHGFDTRTLFEKWTKDVELKRDDMLCISWHTNDSYERTNNTQQIEEELDIDELDR